MQNGYIRIAAERTDRAIMHRRSAAGTFLLQRLSAHRAKPPADRIRRGAVRSAVLKPVDQIDVVGRTVRIGTEPNSRKRRGKHRLRITAPTRTRRLIKADAELLRKPDDRLSGNLRSVPLLEHRQRRLLAANLLGYDALRKFRRLSRSTNASADVWIKFFHR